MFNINFEYPFAFLLILLFLICAYFCKIKNESIFFPHINMLLESNKKQKLLTQTLKYFVILFSIIALASPVKIDQNEIIKNDGINIVLDLDASGSMKNIDLDDNKNRFDVVKEIVKDFISKRTNDNVGVVLFGSWVFMASPISFDKDAQKEIIDYLEVTMAGEKTALIDSIATSVNILKDKKAKSNIIIILSDGEDTASKIPLDVILKLLKKYEIKAYTIGIGNSNQMVLNQIANQSNGKYYTAFSKNDLSLIYEDINQLEKSLIDSNKKVSKEYLFFYPLFIAVLSLIFLIFLKNKE